MRGAGDTGRGIVGIVRWTSTGTGIGREEVVRTAMILGSWISFVGHCGKRDMAGEVACVKDCRSEVVCSKLAKEVGRKSCRIWRREQIVEQECTHARGCRSRTLQ